MNGKRKFIPTQEKRKNKHEILVRRLERHDQKRQKKSLGGQKEEVVQAADPSWSLPENKDSLDVSKSVCETFQDVNTNNLQISNTKPTRGRQWTVSIAMPSSIVDNRQSPQLRTHLIGQIARAAVIYQVDEVVIYDEYSSVTRKLENMPIIQGDSLHQRERTLLQMSRVLQFVECPQYLRKALFPIQEDLQYAGLLFPLNSLHHLSAESDPEKLAAQPYREGVVVNKPHSSGSLVDVGLSREVLIDHKLDVGTRVTVKLDSARLLREGIRKIKGTAVSPSEPREATGHYWGYTVRLANSISAVLTECPFGDGEQETEYDLILGTSERGDLARDVWQAPVCPQMKPSFNHLLVVFGGVQGIEAAMEADPQLDGVSTKDLFHQWINTCPDQGSRTIRTEEAILITMAVLKERLIPTI